MHCSRSLSGRSAVILGMLLAFGMAAVRPAYGDLPAFERIRVLETPRTIPDAELVDQHGQPFRLSALEGRVAFVLFGFTHCRNVCPTAMAKLRELSKAGTLPADEVAYVLISVDGERDTPQAIKAFLAKYSTEFIGLTAEPARVKPIARGFSASFFPTGTGAGGADYDVGHSPQIFIVDPAGRLRAESYGASIEAMTGIARALLDEAG